MSDDDNMKLLIFTIVVDDAEHLLCWNRSTFKIIKYQNDFLILKSVFQWEEESKIN